MKTIIITLTILVVLFTACGPTCPECEAPSAWSSCNTQAQKVRTAYKCSEDTNFECQAFEETLECKTEITAKGVVGDSELVISPSIEKNVQGIISIELGNAPSETVAVAFIIDDGTREKNEGPNLPFDTDGSDGWSIMLDTTDYENGLYSIGAVAGVGFDEGQPPLDAANVQVIIKN